MSEFTITCHADEQINMELRQDPAFYVWNSDAHEIVATVALTGTDRQIHIYCDGEMRIHLWSTDTERKNNKEHAVLRYCDDLFENDIDTDSKLASADKRIEWINNTWFDLYATDHNVGDNGWLNCVTFSVNDAIDTAKTSLINDELWEDENND